MFFPGSSITVRDKHDLIRALKIGERDDFYEATYHSSNNSHPDHDQQRLRPAPQPKALGSMSYTSSKGGFQQVPTSTTSKIAQHITAYLACNAWKNQVKCTRDRGCTCAIFKFEDSFEKSTFANVQITETFWLNKSDKSLRLFTDFRFDFGKANSEQLQDFWKTHNLCPHTNPQKWLEEFFHESDQDFFRGSMGYGDYDSNHNITCGQTGKKVIYIVLNRNLGNRQWPNKN